MCDHWLCLVEFVLVCPVAAVKVRRLTRLNVSCFQVWGFISFTPQHVILEWPKVDLKSTLDRLSVLHRILSTSFSKFVYCFIQARFTVPYALFIIMHSLLIHR